MRFNTQLGRKVTVKAAFETDRQHRYLRPARVAVFLLTLACGAMRAKTATPADWRNDWQERTAKGVYAVRQGEHIRLGNEYLERVFRVSDDVLRTVQLVNKVSSEKPGSQDEPEFSLEVEGRLEGVLGTTDFKLVKVDVVVRAEETLRTSFQLECRRNAALKVTEVVETYVHRRYQRKWLEVDWSGKDDVLVKRIDVEEILFGWWYRATPSHLGYGQPVFAGDLYLGLEYPGAETGQAGYTYLRYYPGRSARGGLKSKTAILGVAKDSSEVREAFFHNYLDTLRPQSLQPFVLYNLHGIGQPNANRLIQGLNVIAPEAQKAGLQIDSFVIDDGWQDKTTVWQPDSILFPDGFASVANAIKRVKSRLGLWLAPDGFTLDTHWGDLRSLEVTHVGQRGSNGRYCIAGPHYSAELKKVLRHYVIDNGVNYFKFDYNDFGCEVATHGHPIWRAGKDAQIDAYIDMLKYVKSLSPRVHIAITTGMWMSPWWTLYADWVWLGGSDMGYEVPSLTSHDSAMTYRDSVLYDDFRVKKYVFPFSAVMTHGFWVREGTLFPQFRDDCMMTIGRGISDWEILTSPQDMDAKRYEFLSRAIRWGKANWDILSDTKMILGDPGKGEVYGYAHLGRGAALVFLRNPSLKSQILDVSLDTLKAPAAEGSANPSAVFEVYPTDSPLDWDASGRSSFQVEVLGAQTKVVVIVWDKERSRFEF
jgi:Melibiase